MKPYDGEHGQAELERLSAEAEQRQTEIGLLTAEAEQRQTEIELLQAEIRQLQTELSVLQATVTELYHSTSWRITAPLRSLRKLMMKATPLRHWFRQRVIGDAPVQGNDDPIMRQAPDGLSSGPADVAWSGATPDKRAFGQLAAVQLATFLDDKQTFVLPRSSSPRVSIILVLYNQAALTFACLCSIKACAEPPLEIVIVDNASSDGTRLLLDRLEGVQVIRNDGNLGFLHACNQAARVARGECLLFLNNDSQLLPGSLCSALTTLESARDIAAVGGRIILLDGALQEAGSIVWKDGSCSGYGRGDSPFAPMYMYQRDVDYCSGAFLLTERKLFDELGGFDADFAPAYYEETDYCFRLRRLGFRTVYDPNAVILHYEFGKLASPGEGIAQQSVNRGVFTAKHGPALAGQYGSSPDNILKARQLDRGKSRILYIEDRVPHRELGQGFPRSNRILSLLVELGFFVTLYPVSRPDEAWHELYSDIPRTVEVMKGYGAEQLESFLTARAGYYDIFLVSRPHNMETVQTVRGQQPAVFDGVRIIYDAEAVFAVRDILQREVRGQPVSREQRERTIREELKLTTAVDGVITVSDTERDYFHEYGVQRVHVLGHALSPSPTPNDFRARRDILFVGAVAEDESPNADSLGWFIEEVFPRVKQNLEGDITLLVAGLNVSKRAAALRGDGVRILGYVEELFPLYNRCRIFIAPTRFASGIPFKAHEAAAHGLPMVASTLISSQLRWDDDIELLASGVDDPEGFAAKCVRLYTDPELWGRLRKNALRRVEADCSPLAYKNRLQKIFDLPG